MASALIPTSVDPDHENMADATTSSTTTQEEVENEYPLDYSDSQYDILHENRRILELLQEYERNSNFLNTSENKQQYIDCFHEFVRTYEQARPSMCPAKFDSVSCWPFTPSGTLQVIPCFSEFNGIAYNSSENATLFCHENSTWADKANYGKCLHSNVLFSVDTSFVDTIALIYYIGHTLSLVAVVLALWIFIAFKDLRCLRNTIHTNLLSTYFLHNLCWTISASIQTKVYVIVNCFMFVALDYFNLTNFMWMFVEGLYLYVLVVKTFSVENIKLRIYNIIGWGIPVPIIIVWIILRVQITSEFSGDSYAFEEEEFEGLVRSCPLVVESATDWIKRVPVILVLCTNIVFLGRIMWVLITKLRSANNVETQRYRKAAKALLVLIPLLGLTYMLLIALPSELEHMRAILLSTQGFWVALFYCFLNSEVQNSIRHHIERWKTNRGLGRDSRAMTLRHYPQGSPRARTDSTRCSLMVEYVEANQVEIKRTPS